MINSVSITNHLGESITLELRFPERSGFLVRGIEGLGPSKAEISMTKVGMMDGAVYNSSRVGSRNIVFSLVFIGTPTIEDTRQKSYQYFPIGQYVDVVIATDNRTTHATGYVESNEPSIFNSQEGTTISILCSKAYLYALQNDITEFSAVLKAFEFPFSNESTSEKLLEFGSIVGTPLSNVYYPGNVPIGFVLHIHAIGTATGVEIYCIRTNELITIDDASLAILVGSGITAGDEIIISSVQGDKYAVLERDGYQYNILNALDRFPKWFKLERGDNLFSYSADSGEENLQFKVVNQIAYEGA